MAILRHMKTSFTGGVFSPALGARVDLEKYRTGLKIAENVFIHPHGGVSNRAGFEFVSYARQGELTVQIPFTANIETDETYALLVSASRIMFTRGGAPVLEDAVESITVADNTGDARFTKVAHGFADEDFVVWTDATNPDTHLRMFEVDYVDADNFDLLDMEGVALTYTKASAGGTFTLRRRYTVSTDYTEEQLRYLSFVQDNDVMYIAHSLHPPAKMSRLGDTDWTLEDIDFTPDTAAPTGVSVAVTTGSGYDAALAEDVNYVVAIVSSVSGEEGLPSTSVTATNDLAIQGAKNVVSWDAGTDVDRYIVYKDTDGVYGYIGATKNTTFTDDNIVEDTSDGPQEAINPFDGAGNYPRVVTLHEQRATYASTINDPQAVYLSQSTLLENFGAASPAKSDDAITFRVRAKARQNIYAIGSVSEGLAMMTSTTEWLVTGGSDESYLTPTNPVPRPQTNRGSYYLQPLDVGDEILYSQARGGVVREFSYSLDVNKFNGADRTIMARHLFEGKRIVSWCYAQAPYSIVWAVMDDGTLLSMTYMKEHDVWGWTSHPTDGFFESVISLPEGDEDAVYVTVRRTIDGVEYVMHERMYSRLAATVDDWFFVDSGLRYSGDPQDTFTGLYHLEGEEVAVLADGYVIEGKTVVDGTVTLDAEYSTVVVGLPYTSEIETLDLDMGAVQELGTIQDREMALPEIMVHIENTRGLWIGRNRDKMNERKPDAPVNYGEASVASTEKIRMDTDPDFDDVGNIVIQQRTPLPMTILAVAPDVSIGG